MCEAGAQVIARTIKKDLGLVFKPSKGSRMDDPIAVPLISSPGPFLRFGVLSPPGFEAFLGEWGQAFGFSPFELTMRKGHGSASEMLHWGLGGDGSAGMYSCTDSPLSSKRRLMASSIRLFGQLAPAVMPTVWGEADSQSFDSISLFWCWS